MNPDNPDNRLPKVILDQLKATSGDKCKPSGKAPRRGAQIQTAGMGVEKSIVLPSECNGLDSYAESGATSHLFCFASAFVPNALFDVFPRLIELADNTTVPPLQEEMFYCSSSRPTCD